MQDTRSSNGTFVNNQRLSPAGEESEPREIFSGDVIQFGVDVVENQRKVTHGCIIATVKLYRPNGQEALPPSDLCRARQTGFALGYVSLSTQEYYELSQCVREAAQREMLLENKLSALQKVIVQAQETAETGWKSMVEEDRLLSQIESLQSKLERVLTTTAHMKDKSTEDVINILKVCNIIYPKNLSTYIID